MSENAFLKKFQGRMEQIGRSGYSEIMNNLHINIVDYLPKPVKVTKPKVKVDKYGYIKSEVSEEFNKNINYMPQTKNLSLSPKKNKTEEIEKININNIKNIKNNKAENINKFNIKNNIETNKKNKKEKEKPIKLFKNIIINNGKDNKMNKDNQKFNSKVSGNNNIANIIKNLKIKNNNKLIESKRISHSLNLNIKLPTISQIPSSPKKIINNKIKIESNIKLNKSYKRGITYTPNLNDINFSNSQIINDNLKISFNKRLNSENGNLKKYIINNQSNLPKIDKKFNKFRNNENDKNIKLYNKQNNNILSSIKNDFLMLDSIKNRSSNLNKRKFEIENNYSELNNNKISQENQIYNYINDLTNSKNLKPDHFRNLNESKNMNPQINLNNKFSKNYNRNNIYDSNENLNSKEKAAFGSNEEKKPNTSLDYIQNIPKLKNKLDIIHEESEDDNKYITDVKFNNSFGNKENLNSLEILMEQRAYFQKKIPKNSRFKLK